MSIPLKGRCSCHKPRMPGEQVGEYDSCALESLKRKCEEYHTLSGAAKPKPCMEMLHFRRSLLCPRRPHLRALALKSVHCSSPPKSGKPLVGYRWAPHYEDLIFFWKREKKNICNSNILLKITYVSLLVMCFLLLFEQCISILRFGCLCGT